MAQEQGFKAVADQLHPFPQIGPLLQTPQASPPTVPTLIDTSGQDVIYIGVFLLLIVVVLIIGIMSRKVGVAVIFALLLSLVLLAIVIIL
jgi:hypothetical protein